MNKKYIAPESTIMEVKVEGVLCGSTFEANDTNAPQGAKGSSIQIWQNQDVAW